MCGLVGYFGKHTLPREKMFRDLLRLGAIRGPHSTGVGFAGINGACTFVKSVNLPDILLTNKRYIKITDKGWYNLYMGHNRWATIGKITSENAHPFDFSHILGCHNGTIVGRYELGDAHKFDVDSEHILYLINKEGIKNIYKKVRGAMALVWWDKRTKTLNFIRNRERPLSYAWTKEQDGLIYASEGWMIRVAALRSGVTHGKIFDVGVHKHYEISYDDANFGKEKIKIAKKKLKPFVPPPYKAPEKNDYDAWWGWRGRNPMTQGVGDTSINTDIGGEPVPVQNNLPGLSKIVAIPIVGQCYSLYPRNIVKTYTKKKLTGYTIICGFQNLDRRHEARIYLHNERDFYLADLYPTNDSLYDKLFFKGRISHSYHSGKSGTSKIYIVGVETVDIIVPLDCKRQTRLGLKLNKRQFDSQYKNCAWCGDPLCFEDDGIIFDENHYDVAVCGKCDNSFDNSKGET